MVGKWHVGRTVRSAPDRGFEHYFGLIEWRPNNYFRPERQMALEKRPMEAGLARTST